MVYGRGETCRSPSATRDLQELLNYSSIRPSICFKLLPALSTTNPSRTSIANIPFHSPYPVGHPPKKKYLVTQVLPRRFNTSNRSKTYISHNNSYNTSCTLMSHHLTRIISYQVCLISFCFAGH